MCYLLMREMDRYRFICVDFFVLCTRRTEAVEVGWTVGVVVVFKRFFFFFLFFVFFFLCCGGGGGGNLHWIHYIAYIDLSFIQISEPTRPY